MDPTTCPHCGASNPVEAPFCESCGKAVPTAASATPRVVGAADIATSAAGQNLQSAELKKESKKAAGALLAVSILQAIFGTFLVFMTSDGLDSTEAKAQVVVMLVVVYGLAAVFFGLFLWARKSPFPAAIVGLVLFVSIHLLDAVADPMAIARGIIVKVIIIVVLVRAIRAGARHRELLRQGQPLT